MKKTKLYILLLLCASICCNVRAQEYHAMTGLLQVPSAETDTTGMFRGNASFLHKDFLPDQFDRGVGKYNTFSYGAGVSLWRWLEVSYCAAFLKYKINKNEKLRFRNEDRRFNVKVVPLYEGKWWPAIALGFDDIGRFNRIKAGTNRNNYFQNIYIAGSKHFNIMGNELGAHLAYRYYPSKKNSNRRGVAGGLTFRPAFFRPLRIVGEWDGVGVNAGADVLLWRHLFVQASLVHGRGFMGGLGYHYTLPH